MLTLHELAEKHGQIAPVDPDGGHPYKWPHRIAALVHGWTNHAIHYADHPIMLSDDDYLATIELAESGSIAQHAAALAHTPIIAPAVTDLDGPTDLDGDDIPAQQAIDTKNEVTL